MLVLSNLDDIRIKKTNSILAIILFVMAGCGGGNKQSTDELITVDVTKTNYVRMKKNIFFYLIFAAICSGCTENNNRVNFIIKPNKRQIIIPIQLNDSITANMTFDSGAWNNSLEIDSTFFVSHPFLLLNILPDTLQTGSAWTDYRVTNLTYNVPPSVKIGNTNLVYNALAITNLQEAFQDEGMEGLFNIPKNDSTHVWELNFERNYLEIHQATNFTMPKNCFICPMKNGIYPFNIQLPLHVKCADGDTLTLNHTYFIDTGMPWDIALKYSAEELDFFNKKEDAVWSVFMDGYFRHYTVSATLFDDFVMDSLRIYTFDYPDALPSKYIIGQNFLKRFNVFFDMKNKQVGLQPIKTFKRIINPGRRRFHFSAPQNSEGKFIVAMVANYKSNYYKTAGFQVGDEIVAVNGKPYKDITWEERSEFYKEDTLIYNLIRDGKPLQIVVQVDKNEEQGE